MLAEEDLSETVMKYQKGKTVSSDLRQLGLHAIAEIAMGDHYKSFFFM